MISVYVLRNTKDTYYIGQTNDINCRIIEHNDHSRNSWASRRGPWEIFFEEQFILRADAMKRERYLKSLKTNKKLFEFLSK